MVTSIVDRFDRANDATGLGTNYTIELGNVQIVDEAALQQAGAGFAGLSRVLRITLLDIAAQRAAIFAEILGTTGSPYAEVFARFREQIATSPGSTDSGYAVRLTRTAAADTLTIQKYDDGVATEKASVAVSLGSPSQRIVPLQIAIQDIDGRVEVTAFFDDLDTPSLTFKDTQAPLWQQVGQVGFHTFEGTGETTPQVIIHEFDAAVLDVDFEDSYADEPLEWNATRIINHIQLAADRNGPLSSLDFSDVLDFLNFVEAQFVADVGATSWLERIFPVILPAGSRFLVLPRKISEEIIDIYDDTNNVMLAHRELHDMNTRIRDRESSSGQPRVWMKVGRSAADKIRLEIYPITSGRITLQVYARALPGQMTATDYPLVPLEYVDALVQGTIVKAGAASGNEKLLRIATATYGRWVRRARARERRSRDLHVIPSRSLPQRQRLPVSRHDARRFPFL